MANIDNEALEVRKKAIALAQAGRLPEEIAADLGISLTIAKIWSDPYRRSLKSGGQHKLHKDKTKRLPLNEWRELRKQGMMDVDIAAKYGVTKQTISDHLGKRSDQRPKKTHPMKLKISEFGYQRCIDIAFKIGAVGGQGWNARSGSIAALLERIATGQYLVVVNESWSEETSATPETVFIDTMLGGNE